MDLTKAGDNVGLSGVMDVTDKVGGALGTAADLTANVMTGGTSGAAGAAIGGLNKMLNKEPDLPIANYGMNLPNAEYGGVTNINGPGHENGGVPLDINGDGAADIEAEGGEAMTKDFIFSDTLKDPETKKTFADMAKSIENKFKRVEDSLSDKTKDFELSMVKEKNRKAKETKEFQEKLLQLQEVEKAAMSQGMDPNLPTAEYGMDMPKEYKNGGELPKAVGGFDLLPYLNEYLGTVLPGPTTEPIGPPALKTPKFNFDKRFDLNRKDHNILNQDEIQGTTKKVEKDFAVTPEIQAQLDAKIKEYEGGSSSQLTDGNKFLLAGSALGPLGNAALLAADIAQKPEEVKRKFADSPITKMRYSDKAPLSDIRQQFAGIKGALQGRSPNTTAANLIGAMDKTQKNLASTKFKVEELNKAQDLSYEDRVAGQQLQNINLFNLYEQQDAMNVAARKGAIRQDVQSLIDTSSQGLANVGDIKNQDLTNQIKFSTLNSLYKKYRLPGQTIEDFKKEIGQGASATQFQVG